MDALQSGVSGGSHGNGEHVVDEEEDEDEDGAAGRWMGLGGPLLCPRGQLPHPRHC